MAAMSELIAKRFLNMIIKLGLNARVMNCGRQAVPEMGVSVVDDSCHGRAGTATCPPEIAGPQP